MQVMHCTFLGTAVRILAIIDLDDFCGFPPHPGKWQKKKSVLNRSGFFLYAKMLCGQLVDCLCQFSFHYPISFSLSFTDLMSSSDCDFTFLCMYLSHAHLCLCLSFSSPFSPPSLSTVFFPLLFFSSLLSLQTLLCSQSMAHGKSPEKLAFESWVEFHSV